MKSNIECNEEYIKSLIDNEVEESIHLDFKDSRSLMKEENKKEEIAKDVSSFANSDGGKIVYGIKEKLHKAHRITPIDGNLITKEWLEQVINSRIKRKIEGIHIHPIRLGNKIEESIYVVEIPRSPNSPHMTKEKKFYKRYNFESVLMEEYEIRESYTRKFKTDLKILNLIFKLTYRDFFQGKAKILGYDIFVQLKNSGNIIEKNYKAEITLPRRYFRDSLAESRKFMEIYRTAEDTETYTFSLPNNSPIFQGEITSTLPIPLIVTSGTMKLVPKPHLLVKLFYSSGIKEKKFNLPKILELEGIPLKDVEFID